jgi:hypothetical protein
MRPTLLLGAALLAGCIKAAPDEVTRAAPEGPAVEASATPPAGAPPGSCWARDTAAADAVEALLVASLDAPATGAEQLFETPCAYEMTPELIASLQRALAARGAYAGNDSGLLDAGTRAALRDWQRPRGIDSGVLAMATARELGLAPYPTEAPARLKRLPAVISGEAEPAG